ncbi:MAG: riboflavin biosynthesis protein RibF [Elusimicrobiaceae bacterium]|nr:riboflavin biosynthesis protein RibF [Elusimicrobiaceae bacterium]
MPKTFITIGTFDGVHRGHKKLFTLLKYKAKRLGFSPLALVFQIPPKNILNNNLEQSVLIGLKQKKELLKNITTVYLDFNKVKDLSADDFFDILINKYKMGAIIVGKDFAFGKNRQGNISFLREKCKQNNIELFVIDFEEEDNSKISSSRLRAALKAGEIPSINKMLGRPFTLEGKVIYGNQFGRKIGFPTANLDISKEQVLPRGVFSVFVYLDGKKYKGICNIGLKPTVTINGIATVEVFIFDFNRDIYGKILRVEFLQKIRDEKKFDGLGELTKQINEDCAIAQKILSKF